MDGVNATTWQDAAKGIAPWPWARIVVSGYAYGAARVWKGVAIRQCPDDSWLWCGDGSQGQREDQLFANPRDIVLNLADPDTCAAFDRRLALRLGCPPEVCDTGVRFVPDHLGHHVGDGWFIEAAMQKAPVWGVTFPFFAIDDRLLARALAWHTVPG